MNDLRSQFSEERSISCIAAIDKALAVCDQQGLQVLFDYVGRELKTYVCNITDKGGYSTSGMGKGLGLQAKASSIYEALEHYYHELECPETQAVTFTKNKVLESPLARGSPPLEEVIGGNSYVFECIRFQSLQFGGNTLDYPAFLTDPLWLEVARKDEQAINVTGLNRYSTNSGTASGSILEDAILHASLELIERDALGIALLRTALKKNPEPVFEINKNTLPIEMQELCRKVASEAGCAISIYDITSDLKVPVILAAIKRKGELYNFFGSGASLYPDYAIERACLEALQCVHSQVYYGSTLPNVRIQDPEGILPYARCFLESGVYCYRGGKKEISYDEFLSKRTLCAPIAHDSTQQLGIIKELAGSQGVEFFVREIPTGSNDLALAQVVAPSLERFHLVSHGIFVSPGFRGKKVIEGTL